MDPILSITDLPMEILVLIYHLLDKFSKWVLVTSCECFYDTLYLEEKDGLCISPNDLWMILAKNNFLSVMDKLSIKGVPSIVIKIGAEKGNLEMIIWARKKDCLWDTDTCSSAASNGHLEILKWARENGCPWNTNTCSQAAGNGHLETLKWARENGCPWNTDTCSWAAGNGHLETLKWARENGCPWNTDTCSWAAEMAI